MDFETFKTTILKKYPEAEFKEYNTNYLNPNDKNGLLCWPKQKLITDIAGNPVFNTSPDDNFGFCIERHTEDRNPINEIFAWNEHVYPHGGWTSITDEKFIEMIEKGQV